MCSAITILAIFASLAFGVPFDSGDDLVDFLGCFRGGVVESSIGVLDVSDWERLTGIAIMV